MRLMMWLAVAMLVIWALRDRRPGGAQMRRQPYDGQAEKMVQCFRCRIHFPASEALADASGHLFCCDDHRSICR